MRRSSCKAEANCELADIAVTSIHSVQLGGPPLKLPEPRMMDHETVQVPVLTNTVALAAKCELVLLWQETVIPKKVSHKRAPDWLAEASKAGKPCKTPRSRA